MTNAAKIAWRNVVILPSDEVMDEAIGLSRELAKKYKTNVALNRRNMWPHITIHQFALPERNLKKLEKTVRAVAKRHKPMRVTMDKYSLFGDSGFFWDAKKSVKLRALHNEMIEKVYPLHEGYIIGDHAPFLTGEYEVGEKRRQALARWGNPLAKEAFWPHITITSFKKAADAAKTLRVNKKNVINFEVKEVHITDVGPSGTCPGSLKKIPLG